MFTDPILIQLTQKYPAPTFQDKSERLFLELVESIISQQLSVKASNTIFARFEALFDTLTPQTLLGMNDEKIRACGVSYQKIKYLKSVADAFINGMIQIDKLKYMSDEEVISLLTQIHGVGRWTAEMILIFTLARPDIFSLGDQGLKNAIEKLYGVTDLKEILALSEKWAPYRSTACWYLWKSLDNT